MNYVVTGCAGFIGSHLCDALLAAGHEVTGIDSFTDYYDPAIKRANIAAAREHDSFRLLTLDLATNDCTDAIADADGIFHLAAQAGVRASWGSEFKTYIDCNILATQRLLEAIATTGSNRPPKIVYSSSSSVYGNAPERPTSESSLPAPISPYGVTKLAAEHLCNTYTANYGIRAASLRYFTVFGERQRPDMAFNKFIRAALTAEPITIFGDGHQSRDFTYVADAVQANISAMVTPEAVGAFNIGGGSHCTVREALAIIGELTSRPLNVSYGDQQLGDVDHTQADTSRARETLCFRPTIDVTTGLAREFDWMQKFV